MSPPDQHIVLDIWHGKNIFKVSLCFIYNDTLKIFFPVFLYCYCNWYITDNSQKDHITLITESCFPEAYCHHKCPMGWSLLLGWFSLEPYNIRALKEEGLGFRIQRAIIFFPRYMHLQLQYQRPYWICTQHPTWDPQTHIYAMAWSYLILRVIPAIPEINALREVLWQQVGKFLLKSIIALSNRPGIQDSDFKQGGIQNSNFNLNDHIKRWDSSFRALFWNSYFRQAGIQDPNFKWLGFKIKLCLPWPCH